MFTSRAEYRLSLRQDNADIRLTKKGFEAGFVGADRLLAVTDRDFHLHRCMGVLNSFALPRLEWAKKGEKFQMSHGNGKYKSASEVLSMADVTLQEIVELINDRGELMGNNTFSSFAVNSYVYDTVEATAKYSNYLVRQDDEMSRWKRSNATPLPADIIYNHEVFPSMSSEELEQLNKHRPLTLHAASQLQGVTPHSVIYLQNYLMKRRRVRGDPTNTAVLL
jgi:tRNA uridine 5-carboxymethylaminomethyl modification enzyme